MQTVLRTILTVLMFVLALVLVLFGVQNTQPVEVHLLTYSSGALSLSLVIIASAILGAALMWIIGLWSAARRGIRSLKETRERTSLLTRNTELERRVASLETELSTLRTPAASSAAAVPVDAPAAKQANKK